MTQNSHHHKPLMVQAPVRALDPDGVTVVTAGTIAFGVAIGVCWWLWPQLNVAGKGWYLGTSIVGFCLGLAGLAFGLRRRHHRTRRGAPRLAATTAPGSEPGADTEAAQGATAHQTPAEDA